MKQTLTLRRSLVEHGDIKPARPLDNDKARQSVLRQNTITKQLSRVNAILARRALTAH